jgi:hypothetical protein
VTANYYRTINGRFISCENILGFRYLEITFVFHMIFTHLHSCNFTCKISAIITGNCVLCFHNKNLLTANKITNTTCKINVKRTYLLYFLIFFCFFGHKLFNYNRFFEKKLGFFWSNDKAFGSSTRTGIPGSGKFQYQNPGSAK